MHLSIVLVYSHWKSHMMFLHLVVGGPLGVGAAPEREGRPRANGTPVDDDDDDAPLQPSNQCRVARVLVHPPLSLPLAAIKLMHLYLLIRTKSSEQEAPKRRGRRSHVRCQLFEWLATPITNLSDTALFSPGTKRQPSVASATRATKEIRTRIMGSESRASKRRALSHEKKGFECCFFSFPQMERRVSFHPRMRRALNFFVPHSLLENAIFITYKRAPSPC